eukprot:c25592_g1_i2 orf=1153-2136(-)
MSQLSNRLVFDNSRNLLKEVAQFGVFRSFTLCEHQSCSSSFFVGNLGAAVDRKPLSISRDRFYAKLSFSKKAFSSCVARNDVTIPEIEDREATKSTVIQELDNQTHHNGHTSFQLMIETKEIEEDKIGKWEGESSVNQIIHPRRIAFDYGFQARFLRKGPTVPRNVFKLAFENFGREWTELRRSYLFAELEQINMSKFEGLPLELVSIYLRRVFIIFLRSFDKLLQLYDGLPELKPEALEMDEEKEELRQSLKKLTLSNEAVWERERSRPPVEAPWWIMVPYYVLCVMLDGIFKDRPIQRFWFLETVARMPYFSYISMLHLYETLGW